MCQLGHWCCQEDFSSQVLQRPLSLLICISVGDILLTYWFRVVSGTSFVLGVGSNGGSVLLGWLELKVLCLGIDAQAVLLSLNEYFSS